VFLKEVGYIKFRNWSEQTGQTTGQKRESCPVVCVFRLMYTVQLQDISPHSKQEHSLGKMIAEDDEIMQILQSIHLVRNCRQTIHTQIQCLQIR